MQTTLLGVAIAIILALVAALVAPLVVDWSQYRAAFEDEASRLTGLTVRVNGSIDARILPSPHFKLRDVAVGAPGREPQIRAGAVELELGLGPLVRGEVRATEMRLLAPQISVRLDDAGALDWPVPASTPGGDVLATSRFTVENGSPGSAAVGRLEDAASGAAGVVEARIAIGARYRGGPAPADRRSDLAIAQAEQTARTRFGARRRRQRDEHNRTAEE